MNYFDRSQRRRGCCPKKKREEKNEIHSTEYNKWCQLKLS